MESPPQRLPMLDKGILVPGVNHQHLIRMSSPIYGYVYDQKAKPGVLTFCHRFHKRASSR